MTKTYLVRRTLARIGPRTPETTCRLPTRPLHQRQPSWTRHLDQQRIWHTDALSAGYTSGQTAAYPPHQLVGHVSVILPGQLLSNSTLHQSRERRKNVDGWVDLLVVQLSINRDLTLCGVSATDKYSVVTRLTCNVTSQI